MKQLLYTLVIIFFSSSVFSSNSEQSEKYLKANSQYEAGNFDDAIKLYEEIIASGYESSDLYFNTANCYYRLNNVGLSVYYYEKSKLLKPFDEDINYNLELAELRVNNKPSEIPEFAFITLLKRIVLSLSYELWGIISLFLFVGFLVFLWFYLNSLNSKQKKFRFLFSAVTLFMSIICFAFAQYQINIFNSENTAVIINKEISAKSSPDENANDIFSVYEGYKVDIEDSLNDWFEIKLTDGKKAWIKKEHLKIL